MSAFRWYLWISCKSINQGAVINQRQVVKVFKVDHIAGIVSDICFFLIITDFCHNAIAWSLVTQQSTRYQIKGLYLSFPQVPLDFIQEHYIGSGDQSKISGQTAKIHFFTAFVDLVKVHPRPKNPLSGSKLVLFQSWVRYCNMAMCFQRFVGVSCVIQGANTEPGPKKSFLH